MRQIKLLIFLTLLLLYSCDSKPVKVKPVNTTGKTVKTAAIDRKIKDNTVAGNSGSAVHKVTVVDSLVTPRYVYLKVKEGPRSYWISTWKMPVKKGDVFYYKDGILKLNFYSKEHNMYFDTLYLISKISKAPVFAKTNAIDKVKTKKKGGSTKSEIDKKIKRNTVALSKLLSQPEKYKGKIIKVKGKCTKVNTNIMGKNWVHIQEKDKSGKVYDLVVTTTGPATVGEECYFEGKIDTKLDLGAGYFFDIIMQDAKRIY